MSEPETPVLLPGAAPDSGYPVWVERWVLPFVRDLGLWPVLAAVVGHFAVVLAPLLLWVFRGRNPFGAVLLLAVGWLSGQVVMMDVRALRRPGALTVVLALTWALAGLMAWAGNQYGLL